MTQPRRRNKPSLDAINQFQHVADGATSLSQAATLESDPEGDTKQTVIDALKQMDLDDIRDIFDQQGLEVRQTRTSNSDIISNATGVKGKKKLSIWLPAEMREALEDARRDTRKNLSYMVEQAVGQWLSSKGMRHN
jgi:hypothetical protein